MVNIGTVKGVFPLTIQDTEKFVVIVHLIEGVRAKFHIGDTLEFSKSGCAVIEGIETGIRKTDSDGLPNKNLIGILFGVQSIKPEVGENVLINQLSI